MFLFRPGGGGGGIRGKEARNGHRGEKRRVTSGSDHRGCGMRPLKGDRNVVLRKRTPSLEILLPKKKRAKSDLRCYQYSGGNSRGQKGEASVQNDQKNGTVPKGVDL